jgi:hypothetical protein
VNLARVVKSGKEYLTFKRTLAYCKGKYRNFETLQLDELERLMNIVFDGNM